MFSKIAVEDLKLFEGKMRYSKESNKARLLLNAVLVEEFQKASTLLLCKIYHKDIEYQEQRFLVKATQKATLNRKYTVP